MDKKNFLQKNIANIITCIRIIGTVIMIFTSVLSKPFYIVYTISGLSDALDGFVARRTGIESKNGARLDSVADLFFFITMMIMILPTLIEVLPRIIIVVMFVIFGARVIYYIYFGLTKHKFISNHTILNKLTGFMLFLVPYFVMTKFFAVYASIICAITIISLIDETITNLREDDEI
ncbi:MAG: CDP-alcohol phosphatidyltransferase family protein [Clostridia bacterium]|nr:CDP-alcohol phosphatidyltransferase family protein [Clostridia bacterium]